MTRAVYKRDGEMKVYFMQDGKPEEIKISTELNIKLSKKQKKTATANARTSKWLYFLGN